MEGLKICKHCKEKINDESEMITCSSCRSTYHKECWSKCKCYIICPESEVSDYNLNEDNSEEKTFSE